MRTCDHMTEKKAIKILESVTTDNMSREALDFILELKDKQKENNKSLRKLNGELRKKVRCRIDYTRILEKDLVKLQKEYSVDE